MGIGFSYQAGSRPQAARVIFISSTIHWDYENRVLFTLSAQN